MLTVGFTRLHIFNSFTSYLLFFICFFCLVVLLFGMTSDCLYCCSLRMMLLCLCS